MFGNRRRIVASTAKEYCCVPQSAILLPFQIDHIRAEKHGGETVEANLALACTHCNRHKGPNIAGFDTETARIVRLFSPRTDRWEQHFRVSGAPGFSTGRTR